MGTVVIRHLLAHALRVSVTRARFLLGLVMLGVYGTLGYAHDIARAVRGAGMLRVFVASAVVVPMALGVRELSRRGLLREWRTWFVLAGAVVVYAAAIQRTVTLEETLHLVEYGVVGVLARMSVSSSPRATRGWLKAWLVAALLGAIDEAIQGWLPNRTGDVRDVLLNATAAGIPLLVGLLLSKPLQTAEAREPTR